MALLILAAASIAPTRASGDELSTSTTADRAELGERTLRFGTSIRHYDYLEGDGAGDSERGTMPGISLGFEYRPERASWFTDFTLDGLDSHTQYDGSDMTHTIPVTSQTIAQILDLEWDVGVNLVTFSNDSILRGYSGMGFHYWRRGDQGVTNGVSSYREDYSWWVLPVGAKLDLPLARRLSLELDASAQLAFAGTLDAYMSQTNPQLADVNIPLGAHFGFRLQTPIVYQVARTWGLELTPWAEYWTIGTSSMVPLAGADGGIVVDQDGNQQFLEEPTSRTIQYGSTLSFRLAI